MNKPPTSKKLATALTAYRWMPDLQQSVTEHEEQQVEETEESDDSESEAVPQSFEEYERHCYDELIRIHREALEHPMTDQVYARAKAIVAEWKQKKSEHDLTATSA